MKKIGFFFLVLIGYLLFLPNISSSSVLAVKYSLIPPTGDLVRGQTVRFTINVDTQGATLKTGVIGMTYETQYLEYISTAPGNAMNSVSVSQLGDGKILFSGENTTGFTGQGVFAYVDFRIIAQAPGSTELCVLWAPSPTPTVPPEVIPTTPPGATAAPTSPPAATNLPTSGETRRTTVAASLGFGFLAVFSLFYFLDKKIVFKKPKKS